MGTLKQLIPERLPTSQQSHKTLDTNGKYGVSAKNPEDLKKNQKEPLELKNAITEI